MFSNTSHCLIIQKYVYDMVDALVTKIYLMNFWMLTLAAFTPPLFYLLSVMQFVKTFGRYFNQWKHDHLFYLYIFAYFQY